jgi:hypothetical protein
VENAYEETALIQAVLPGAFEQQEEQMLVLAKRWLAQLPFRQADVLIVDEIGKDISGSGMDTNVIGRKRAFRAAPAPDGQPLMRRIFVRGLSEKTHGNATGIGNADFTTTRLVESMNYRATVINCLTAGYPEGATLPVYFDTDREVLDAALAVIGTRESQDARVMRIRNTMHLQDIEISEPCFQEPSRATTFAVQGTAQALRLNPDGNLPPL